MIKAIAINKLIASPKNVRKAKSSESADAELVASIRHLGLQNNLIVEPSKKQKGMFEVIAGERRRQALLILVQEKHFKATEPVDCKITEAENAEEISYTENATRQNMHPADEFETFNRLINESKLSEEEVAERYGITVKHVKQRMSLAAVHPDIIQAYKGGAIALDVVKAFTVEPDQQKQAKGWKELKRELTDKNTVTEEAIECVKDYFSENKIGQDHKLVKFVTLKAYKSAGGATVEDLFGDQVFIADEELLNRLAIEKLSKQGEKLKTAGWLWVDVSLEEDRDATRKYYRLDDIEPADLAEQYRKLEKQRDELDENADDYDDQEQKIIDQMDNLEEEIQEKTAFDPEQMKLAGCTISIGYSGKPNINTGYVKKEQKADLDKLLKKDKKPSAKAAADDEFPSAEEFNEAAPKHQRQTKNQAEEESIGLPQGLKTDLRNARETIARLHLAYDPELARDLLYFTICNQILGDADDSTLIISFGRGLDLPPTESLAGQKYCEYHDGLKMSWKDDDLVAGFEKFRKLDSNYKQQLFAFCASSLMHVTLFSSDPEMNNPLTESVIKLMQIKWHEYWLPNTESFYKWLNKNQLAKLGAKFHSDPEGDWKITVSKSNKAQLVAKVEELIKSKNPKWLPEGFESK